jgi:hypothetical protein
MCYILIKAQMGLSLGISKSISTHNPHLDLYGCLPDPSFSVKLLKYRTLSINFQPPRKGTSTHQLVSGKEIVLNWVPVT